MPEQPNPKPRQHPYAEFYREPMLRSMNAPKEDEPPRPIRRIASCAYADLHVTSNFTFLTGASYPEELIERAAQLGQSAIAITDEETLGGIVRAHIAAKDAGIQLIV